MPEELESPMLMNGSFFYNPETKRLHEGNFVAGVLTPPAGKEKSSLTFNLVPVEYTPGFPLPGQRPVDHLDVLRFPTTATMTTILAVVRDAIGANKWSIQMTPGSKTSAPKKVSDAPYILVINEEGSEALLEAREIAYDLVEHDRNEAIREIQLTLRNQGFPI